MGPCLRRLAHVVAEAAPTNSPQTLAWRARDEQGNGKSSFLFHQPYRISKEKLKLRENDKENLVREVLESEEVSVKDLLSSWVRKMGSRHIRSCPLQEEYPANSRVAKYVPYNEVARTVNAVMKDLGQRGYSKAALEVFEWMQLQGWCKLDPHLYTTVIYTLGNSGCLHLAEQIFADLEGTKVKKDTVLYNALLHARSKAGQVQAVLDLFDAMKEESCRPNLITFNTVMDMFVKEGVGLAKVISVFKQMCKQGVQPDVVSYDILLAACATGDHVKEAQHLYEAMKKRGVKPTVITYTSLIAVYANTGDCRAALQVFNEMLTAKCNPNVVTFTAIINACGRGGNVEEAQTIFEAMKEFGVKPNVMTYNAMIDVYRKHGEHKLAQLTFQEMIQAGLQPTNVSFTCLMSSFKAAGAYDEVVHIYESAKQSSLLCSVQTYTEALDACVKSKNLAGVTRIMDDMRMAGCSPNAVTCSVVLVALGSKCSNVDEAHLLLTCLQGFDSILVHCCRNLLVLPKSDNEVSELMGDIFRTIKKEDVKTWTVLSSSLMDALWALGWYRRAALVLAWVYQRNLFDGLTVLAQSEWKLDVRRLSTGGALVTFYQWLAHLLQVVHQVDLIVYSHHAGRLPQNSDLNSESTQIDRTEIDSLFQVEVLVPLFPLNLHELENRGVVSLTKDSEDKQKLLFPSLVTVVTGWGKLSKEEGSSQVRDGVEREIMKLGVPLRASYDAGRWTAKSEALIRWLLRPETAARLVLWDIPAETPH